MRDGLRDEGKRAEDERQRDDNTDELHLLLSKEIAHIPVALRSDCLSVKGIAEAACIGIDTDASKIHGNDALLGSTGKTEEHDCYDKADDSHNPQVAARDCLRGSSEHLLQVRRDDAHGNEGEANAAANGQNGHEP